MLPSSSSSCIGEDEEAEDELADVGGEGMAIIKETSALEPSEAASGSVESGEEVSGCGIGFGDDGEERRDRKICILPLHRDAGAGVDGGGPVGAGLGAADGESAYWAENGVTPSQPSHSFSAVMCFSLLYRFSLPTKTSYKMGFLASTGMEGLPAPPGCSHSSSNIIRRRRRLRTRERMTTAAERHRRMSRVAKKMYKYKVPAPPPGLLLSPLLPLSEPEFEDDGVLEGNDGEKGGKVGKFPNEGVLVVDEETAPELETTSDVVEDTEETKDEGEDWVEDAEADMAVSGRNRQVVASSSGSSDRCDG